MSDLREQLADLAHRQWAGWMRYVFGKCVIISAARGDLAIRESDVQRWQRQIATPYAELSEEERESDRRESDRVLAVVQEPLRAFVAELRERAAQWYGQEGDSVAYQIADEIEARFLLPAPTPDTVKSEMTG